MEKKDWIKPPAEAVYAKQLAALAAADNGARKPAGWRLSPKAVRTFVLGSPEPLALNGEQVEIEQKFYGDDTLIERCIITLAGDRGLMLVGEPGTAKTMLSELFSAAISGSTTNTVQGTAGVTDDDIKYSWNYALLLARGPVAEALVPAPLYTGMRDGVITRFEEITRCPSEVQDTLISVMSDKVLSIPEFGAAGFLFARPGFNIIATANTRDKGVNEMSSALKRRFNFETVEPVASVKLECEIIARQCRNLLRETAPEAVVREDMVKLLATVFHELREGESSEGYKLESPAAVLSTAEAVSLYCQSALTAHYYETEMSVDVLTQNIRSAVLKESRDDLPRLKAYWNTVVKKRAGGDPLWRQFFQARSWLK
ncbi:MAG: AAA family ATPase [Gracilibacteraceae bacterium]|jgi:MoxR-like ATPase|nr:AAA family ATPase [Gracilibacteraceae bacterium]